MLYPYWTMRFSQRFSNARLRLNSFAFSECKDTKKIDNLQIFGVKKHDLFQMLNEI